MNKLLLVFVFGAVIGAGGLALAQNGDAKRPTVKVLSSVDVEEVVGGKKAKATTVEVSFPPARRAPRTDTPARSTGTCWRASSSSP